MLRLPVSVYTKVPGALSLSNGASLYFENLFNALKHTGQPPVDCTPIHFQFRSMHLTQIHPNDALLTSESQPSQALAESRRLWILKNAPSDYHRIYLTVVDHLHLGIRTH